METIERFKQMPPSPGEALVLHLGEVLPRMAGTQARYKVTEVPTLRTLRFYVARGLLDKPLRYEGRTALYGYRHLLQAVAIKVLQANLLPLRKIGEMLQGLGNEDLERLLEVTGRPGGAGGAELPGQLVPGRRKTATRLDEGSALNLPQLRELLKVRLDALPALAEGSTVTCRQSRSGLAEPSTRATAWRRLEIEPGVELHLREDVTIKPGSRLEVLVTKIKYLLTQESPA